MTDIKNINEQVLVQTIREIISKADLNVMTAKLVRTELKTKLNVVNLDSRKKQISSIIDDVVRELNEANDKKKKEENDEDCNGSKAKQPPKNKGSDTSESSDGDISDNAIDDESLARKLHDEELGSKRRSAKKVVKGKTNKKKDNSEAKPKKSTNNGYTKPCPLSAELAEFVGAPQMPRHEVVKHMWAYVKDNNLLDPKNKQFAICDPELAKILGRKRVRMFGIMKQLNKHFIK